MRAPTGWYALEQYLYDKETDVLRYTVYVEFRKYFDGDDWSWEEQPVRKEITDPEEKKRVLKEYPELLE